MAVWHNDDSDGGEYAAAEGFAGNRVNRGRRVDSGCFRARARGWYVAGFTLVRNDFRKPQHAAHDHNSLDHVYNSRVHYRQFRDVAADLYQRARHAG